MSDPFKERVRHPQTFLKKGLMTVDFYIHKIFFLKRFWSKKDVPCYSDLPQGTVGRRGNKCVLY